MLGSIPEMWWRQREAYWLLWQYNWFWRFWGWARDAERQRRWVPLPTRLTWSLCARQHVDVDTHSALRRLIAIEGIFAAVSRNL